MIKIVYGAPFSGKTTFVKNKVEKNDLVYDFDALMQSLTFAEYQDTNSNLIDLNKDIRDLIIKQSQNDDINNTYIITTFIDNKLKDKLRDLKVKKIKMETEKEVCLSRLKNSSRKNKKEIKEVIDKWFDYYHEDERGELMENKEVRHFQLDDIEIRKDEDNKIESFEGYVVKYDTRSHFLGFYETVDKRAFDNTLQSNNNIFALYNHDWDKPLASTHNKSLELSTDDTGLKFKLTPKANTSFMNDVRELVNSGELRGCSFGF